MRAIVDRWVTPVMVILAASSVVFAATWTMATKFSAPDQFAGREAPRSATAPLARASGPAANSAIAPVQAGSAQTELAAPIGVGANRQAPIGGAAAVAPNAGAAPSIGQAAPPAGIGRTRDASRQGARLAPTSNHDDGDDHDDDDDHAQGSRTESPSSRTRNRH